MAVRPFVMWPDARLATACADVAAIDDAVRATWDDMIDTMEAMPGLGLAACQIGVMRRLAVVDASDARGRAVRMANPEIVMASAETAARDEASPNLPGLSARVERPARVRVRFLDVRGTVVERDYEGLWARSVQHQIDHLAGRMFIDRLSRTRRAMLIARARKLARKAG